MGVLKKVFLLLSALFIISGLQQADAAFTWEEIPVKGRTYVPVENIRSFYGLSVPVKHERGWHILEGGTSKNSIQVRLRPHSQEMRMNQLLFILSFPIIQDASGRLLISKTDVIKIVDPILRPHYIKGAGNFTTVILDPGHGGHDAGATNGVVKESDLNLRLAKMVRSKLEQKGFRVVLTRENDTFLTLQQRVDIANRYQNAIFVSIHFNSGRKGAHGIETFTLTPVGTSSTFKPGRTSDYHALRGNAQDSSNIALATAIQGIVQRKLNAEDRGIKRARFSVLCGIRHPAVLFEGGFISHSRECQLLVRPDYMNRMAHHLVEGISKYKRIVGGKAQPR